MDVDIESLVKKCSDCQESRPVPPTAPLDPWEWPATPWSRIHLDFVGPYLGHMYLVLVDAHSKWMDVKIMRSITANQDNRGTEDNLCHSWTTEESRVRQWSNIY